MKITVCDRCGRRIDREPKYEIRLVPDFAIRLNGQPDYYCEKELCERCFKGLLDALSPVGKGLDPKDYFKTEGVRVIRCDEDDA